MGQTSEGMEATKPKGFFLSVCLCLFLGYCLFFGVLFVCFYHYIEKIDKQDSNRNVSGSNLEILKIKVPSDF